MWKTIFVVIGAILTIIAKTLIWEVVGLGVIIGVLMIPKKRKTFTRIR